ATDPRSRDLYTLSLHDALPIFTMLHGVETSPTAIAKIEESIENGLPCAVTLLNYRKDRTPFCNELRISLTKDKNGEIIGHVGFRSEEHTPELQSRENLVCRLLL